MKVVEALTRDESAATEVTTGLLRRPDVAFKDLALARRAFRNTP